MTTATQSRLQATLLRGEVVRGEFWIASSEVASAGTLHWTYSAGATLNLIGDTRGWPSDLGRYHHVIHGILESNERVSLFDAGVSSLALLNVPTRFTGNTLIWDFHATPESRWARAVYETSNLAGWVADNGLEAHLSTGGRMDGVVVRPARKRHLNLPRADAWLATEVDADSLGYQADWSVKARQRLVVDVRREATIDDLYIRYAVPLLCFTSFVSDRPDSLITEVVLTCSRQERAEIWRAGPRYEPEAWTPGRGYLFWAEDLPRVSAAFSTWWRLYAESPALGLFADHINLGPTYSQPRFLTLYTALEGYCRRRVGRNNLRQLREYTRVSTTAHGCTNQALKLIGASRDYVAHFTVHDIPADTVIDSLVDATRCGHALMQACLLRNLGFGRRQAENILRRYYRSWPLPQL